MNTILNIVIPARNFDSTVSFYKNALGLPVKVEGGEFCFFDGGGVNIAIHPVKENSDFKPTGRSIYLDVCIRDWEATRNRLIDMRVEIRREWQEQGHKFLLVADPEDNLLELIEFQDAESQA